MKKTKIFDTSLEVNPGKREILAIISTDDVDSDGDVVLPGGLMKKQYAGMPVLWAHQQEEPAIGTVLWVKAEANRVLAKYRLHDKTELARDVFSLLQTDPELGIPLISKHSVGMQVYEANYPTYQYTKDRPDWENAKQIISKWELFEFSVCNVPANDNCVALAVSKGIKLLGEEKSRWVFVDSETVYSPEDLSRLQVKESPIPAFLLTPKYCRKINKEAELMNQLASYLSPTEIIEKLAGRI